MANHFVTVARYSDPILAQMAVDVLKQEGIVATAPGVRHSGLLGGAGSVLLEIAVQVPRSDAVRASELLEALEEGGEVVDEDAPEELLIPSSTGAETALVGDGPYRERRGAVAKDAGLRPILGSFIAVVFTLGAGHFYARERFSGALLALVEVASCFVACADSGKEELFVLLPVVVAVDVFGAGAAVKRANAGQVRSPAEQLLRTGLWVALGAVALYFLGGRLDAGR